MEYRRLGKSELQVSAVGLGTWQFGGEWGKDFSPEEVCDLVARAKSLDINLIDTAECYGDHLSESLVGQAIKGQRDYWIVATKFGHHYHGHLQRTEHWNVRIVLAQLEDSLRALHTDYIDLYQFHSGEDAVFDQQELWTMLDKQVRAGKIRHLGNSIGDQRASYQVSRSFEVGVSVIQAVYNRLDRSVEETILKQAQKLDLGILAREPLANGLLSGKYPPGATAAVVNDWRSAAWPTDVWQERLREVDRIRRAELPEDAQLAPWALAWVLKHPAVGAVIPGCKSIAQLESNAAAVDLVQSTKGLPRCSS